MAPSQPLPPKENALFKKIIKCYEMKQYKNGLKFAKQILSNPKFAEHGETLAMKGLTLNCMGRKEEAYEYVKRGLRNDLKSHVCWHVYGLLQRSDHKYDEAIKCYRNALKWEKDNIQILRDLSMLQIHMRDLEGYRDTRYRLFSLRPATKVSWVGYAMAYHLLKDYDMALSILEALRKTTSGSNNNGGKGTSNSGASNENNQENSELLLYHISIYREAGKNQEALDFLKQSESEICDKLAVHELKSQLLLGLGRPKEAVKIIRDKLIDRNPENRQYYSLLEESLGISGNDSHRLKLYLEFQSMYPKAQLPFRLPLAIITDPRIFHDLIDPYIKKSLRRGQPALFKDLKPLYLQQVGPSKSKVMQDSPPPDESNDVDGAIANNNVSNGGKASDDCPPSLPFKIEIIEQLMTKFYHNLKNYYSFDEDESSHGSEDPTTILWVSYYLGQHFDYLGNYDRAMEYVNESLEHTPTLIEFHVLRGKIFKHQGLLNEAVAAMEEAQSLDTADRYLNSKCAKYLLRANRISDAEEMCKKFTREGVSPAENLNEMQCMWFQTEAAKAYQRLGQWGESLKKCTEVDRHFIEITEDQFDFHIYCMRKMTLMAYVGLLRLEDILKSHPFYFTAAKVAIEVYLHLYDHPLGENDSSGKNANPDNMTPAELKKLRALQRKEEKKKQREKEQQQQAKDANKDKTKGENAANPDCNPSDPVFEALDPAKLERPEDPLGEALRFLRPLQQLARERIETHLFSFEIHWRRGKILLMLQSLKRAVGCLVNSFTDHERERQPVEGVGRRYRTTFEKQLKMFILKVSEVRDSLAEPIRTVIDGELATITSKSLCKGFEEVSL